MKKNILNIFNITSDQYDAIEKTGLTFKYKELAPTKNNTTVYIEPYDIYKIVTPDDLDVTIYILDLINNLKSNSDQILEILEEYRFEKIDKFTIDNITSRLCEFMYNTGQYTNNDIVIDTHLKVKLINNTLRVIVLLDNDRYSFNIK